MKLFPLFALSSIYIIAQAQEDSPSYGLSAALKKAWYAIDYYGFKLSEYKLPIPYLVQNHIIRSKRRCDYSQDNCNCGDNGLSARRNNESIRRTDPTNFKSQLLTKQLDIFKQRLESSIKTKDERNEYKNFQESIKNFYPAFQGHLIILHVVSLNALYEEWGAINHWELEYVATNLQDFHETFKNVTNDITDKMKGTSARSNISILVDFISITLQDLIKSVKLLLDKAPTVKNNV